MQVVVIQRQFGHTPVGICGYAIPIAEERVARPVRRVCPVWSIRPAVQRDQRVKIRAGVGTLGNLAVPYSINPRLEFGEGGRAQPRSFQFEGSERETRKPLGQWTGQGRVVGEVQCFQVGQIAQ